MKRFSWIGTSKIWFGLSALLIFVTIVSLFTQGLNFSIDFTGGTRYSVVFEETKSVSEVRDAVENLGYPEAVIQQSTEQTREFYIVTSSQSEEERLRFQSGLESELGAYELRSVDSVSPVIGSELRSAAIWAVLPATLGMWFYILIRFEWRFAVAAILALTHDVILTVGLFSVFQLTVDTTFIAAILTIYGYSINDTIIVFDRIRENLQKKRKETLAQLVDNSVQQVLVRSINTSVTTLLAIGAVFVLGGSTLRPLALALIFGIAVGTYSSIFLASPLYVWLIEGKIGGRKRMGAQARSSS